MFAIDIITLFPDMFDALDHGILGRARRQQLLNWTCWNPRDYTEDEHHRVDDRPYGGGPGMVMLDSPLRNALKAVKIGKSNSKVVYLSPQGKKLTQEAITSFVEQSSLVLICGRYEGIDERLIESEVDEEWSLGDYVLSGGELAAMVLIDAMARLIPGVLGHKDSAEQDSFVNGLLDYPHYTRPAKLAETGMAVPSVLLEGDHQAIARWRLKQSLARTWKRRPDLLLQRPLDKLEQELLNEFINEQM